ncbi:MAG: PAS domain-containing protein [Nevskiaceae bacterium]|jgi:PAS domain S-box-containing protein|nr:PAS domain-containing protein [Nevskiaceae bacterium]
MSILFSTLSDRLHEVVIVHGQSILYCNRQFVNLLGIEREQALGRALHDWVSPDQSQMVATNLRRVLAGEGGQRRFEIDLIGASEQVSRLEITLTPTQFEGAATLLITGVEVIPTQTLPMLSLPLPGEAPRSRARLALDCLGEALLTTDSRGVIDYANPAAIRLLNLEGRDPLHRTIEQVIHPTHESDRRRWRDAVESALNGVAMLGAERPQLRLAGGAGAGVERAIELSVAPLRSGESGKVTGAVLLLYEVTEPRGPAR